MAPLRSILSALLLAGCASVPQSECRRVAMETQNNGEINCVRYADKVTPLLRNAGATNVRWAIVDTGLPLLHCIVSYDNAGFRWMVDNKGGPRHAVGDTVREQCQRFVSPWHEDVTCATLVAEVEP